VGASREREKETNKAERGRLVTQRGRVGRARRERERERELTTRWWVVFGRVSLFNMVSVLNSTVLAVVLTF